MSKGVLESWRILISHHLVSIHESRDSLKTRPHGDTGGEDTKFIYYSVS